MSGLLEVKELAVHFPSAHGTIKAIDGVSLSLQEGETLGIAGESGSGKSMTALALLGLIPKPGKVVHGEIIFEGENLEQNSERQMRRLRGRKLAMILQDPMTSLNPAFSIGQQVAESFAIHHKLRRRSKRTAVLDILGRVKIPAAEDRIYDYPHQMSGGMRQRVVGAIMLSTSPKLLIADEPTTALDVTIQAQYLHLLAELQREFGFALIFVSHDLAVVSAVCDRLAIMYAGRIVEYGATEEVLARPSHPYTHALLKCLPKLQGVQERLVTIDGQPPDARAFPAGCRFAPRCPRAQDRCQREYPGTTDLTDRHEVNCFFPVEYE